MAANITKAAEVVTAKERGVTTASKDYRDAAKVADQAKKVYREACLQDSNRGLNCNALKTEVDAASEQQASVSTLTSYTPHMCCMVLNILT